MDSPPRPSRGSEVQMLPESVPGRRTAVRVWKVLETASLASEVMEVDLSGLRVR